MTENKNNGELREDADKEKLQADVPETDAPETDAPEADIRPEQEITDAACDNDESADGVMARRRGIYDFVEMLTGSVAVVILIFTLLFRLSSVEGTSMINTLQDGDRLIVSSIVTDLKYGDIVAIQKTSGYTAPLVKRVIATGGETVIFDFPNWKVSIKGTDGTVRELDEYYVKRVSGAMKRGSVPATDEVYVPEGYVFVMGDNRNGSTDSRDPAIGLISEHEIMGKAILRIFPLNNIGSLKLKND